MARSTDTSTHWSNPQLTSAFLPRSRVDACGLYGVQSFLESRGIALPRGKPEDAAEMETVCGLGNRKNALFLAELKEHGVEPYETTICLHAQDKSCRYRQSMEFLHNLNLSSSSSSFALSVY